MDANLIRAFQGQILLQCRFILRAQNDIDVALKKHGEKPSPETVDAVFYALQSLLTAAANIFKALWGQAGSLETERKPLRDSIGISNASPLRDVGMRDNFDHFDERLTRWHNDPSTRSFVDLIIIPSTTELKSPPFKPLEEFRVYHPDTTDLVFWGQTFNVREIVNEAHRLVPIIQRAVSTFPPPPTP